MLGIPHLPLIGTGPRAACDLDLEGLVFALLDSDVLGLLHKAQRVRTVQVDGEWAARRLLL